MYADYAELVQAGLKGGEGCEDFLAYLRLRQQRSEAEREMVREWRKKRPGLADFEILKKCEGWLEKNYPVPSFPLPVGFHKIKEA